MGEPGEQADLVVMADSPRSDACGRRGIDWDLTGRARNGCTAEFSERDGTCFEQIT
jgi:hypothetical protein